MLSAAQQARPVNVTLFDIDAVVEEIVRYLVVVEAFRAENCEPFWLAELRREVRAANDATSPARSSARMRKQKRT